MYYRKSLYFIILFIYICYASSCMVESLFYINVCVFMKTSYICFSPNNLIQQFSTLYGIGRKKSLRICDNLGLCPTSLYAEFSATDQDRMFFYIQQNFFTEQGYKNIVKKDIQHFIEISCFRGIRHNIGLPCRGQRTHGNAKTVRKNTRLLKKKSKKSRK